MRTWHKMFLNLAVLTLLAGYTIAHTAQSDGDDKLRKASQNPVADLISVPFQNNTLFGIGPGDVVANVLNIQPVIPVRIHEDWNLITRTIAPLIYLANAPGGLSQLPEGSGGLADLPGGSGPSSVFGLGDINTTLFVSPAKPDLAIWGIGPSITFPTATTSKVGTQKWSAGPSGVVLFTPKPWVAGSLVRQIWSFAGDDDRKDVSQLLVQPFVNYNLPGGWYLVSAPIITADWEVASGQRWNVPVGGGAGRLFRIGTLPVNSQAQAFYHVERPSVGPEWSLRVQIQFLFPKT